MPWNAWQPTRVERGEHVMCSSMDTAVVMTDVGRGYLKALGNREGEHALACELIGTSLAEWIGLPVLDYALIEIGHEDEIFLDADDSQPIRSRRRAKPGPGFITKALEDARPWSGDSNALDGLKDIENLSGLVVLDTWVGNPDRHPRRPPNANFSTWQNRNLDNVMLHRPRHAKKDRLVAMDFSVCLYCRGGGLRSAYEERLARDDGVYGLFPEFEAHVTAERVVRFLDRLRQAEALQQHLVEVMRRIPSAW